MNNSKQLQRMATFRAAAIGLPAYTVAIAINTLTPGIDWRGCGKKEMAKEFAGLGIGSRLKNVTGAQLRAAIDSRRKP